MSANKLSGNRLFLARGCYFYCQPVNLSVMKMFRCLAMLAVLLRVSSALAAGLAPVSVPATPGFPDTLYQSKSLVIIHLTQNVYVHTTYLQSETFGHVPCNCMIVAGKKNAVVFDTPAGDTAARELIGWIQDKLNKTIQAVVPTHFHGDCLGALHVFHQHNIPSYAHAPTIALARQRNFPLPAQDFEDSLIIDLGRKKLVVKFFGEGHTADNVVAYVPGDDVLFGGCLVKALGAGKGNLEDATQPEWSNTVEKVKKAYPSVKWVIPGHGPSGDAALLDFTIRLFDEDRASR